MTKRSASSTTTGRSAREVFRCRAALVIGVLLVGCLVVADAPALASSPRASGSGAEARTMRALKLVNYYPSTGGWSLMWSRWNPAELNHDFAKISGVANAVRVIVQPQTFGFPVPDRAQLSELHRTLRIAQKHHLLVQLTLFDLWSDYSNLQGSDTWSRDILKGLHDSPELAFVELQNEINPFDGSAMAWARHELPFVKGRVGSVPVTVSVSDSAGTTSLAALKAGLGSSQPDFFDVHFYGSPNTAYAELAADQKVASPLDLYVGETGYPTLSDSPGTRAVAEANQSFFYECVDWAAETLGLPAPAPWIYQDFTPNAIPPGVLGSSGQSQFTYGLVRVNGTKKPAWYTEADFIKTGVADTGFNGSFEIGSGSTAADWLALDADQGAMSRDPSMARTGHWSLRFADTTGTPLRVATYETFPVLVPTHAGQRFKASVWATGSTAGYSRIAILWYGPENNLLGQSDSPGLPAGSTGWVQLSVTSSAPPGATSETVSLKSSDDPGTTWFDDVSWKVFSS